LNYLNFRILEWSSLSGGLHLLSVDMRDKMCVWRMNGVNDWVCVHESTMENVIAAKWVTFEGYIRVYPPPLLSHRLLSLMNAK
jgi:hypothetical protein